MQWPKPQKSKEEGKAASGTKRPSNEAPTVATAEKQMKLVLKRVEAVLEKASMEGIITLACSVSNHDGAAQKGKKALGKREKDQKENDVLRPTVHNLVMCAVGSVGTAGEKYLVDYHGRRCWKKQQRVQ